MKTVAAVVKTVAAVQAVVARQTAPAVGLQAEAPALAQAVAVTDLDKQQQPILA